MRAMRAQAGGEFGGIGSFYAAPTTAMTYTGETLNQVLTSRG